MRRIITLALILLAGSTTSQTTLKGTVYDQSGKTIPGAIVKIEDTYQSIITGVAGQYVFKNIEPGSYSISASFIGYKTTIREVEVSEGENTLDLTLQKDIYETEAFTVVGVIAKEGRTPTTQTTVDEKEIEDLNLGQDLPYILRYTPSVVTTSDAGAGVGYTGFRVRGSDPSRVNVTINGIPLNDAESQGVFWVNLPDFASSVDRVSIQRGVGTSTNGAGAFGATVNLQTTTLSDSAYANLANSYGSFNTRKHTVEYGTGLIDGKFAFDGRLSQIASDGYIDRATSDLKSMYLNGTYFGKKTTVKAIGFIGKERTYQSWWGTPEEVLEGDMEAIEQHALLNGYNEAQTNNILNSGRTFNYYLYENEVDNYQQDHFQLHIGHEFSPQFRVNIAGHYTKGRGYYEQFKYDEPRASYGWEPIEFTDPGDTVFIENPIIPGDTLFYDVFGDTTFSVEATDLIRRRWLDNDFYGATWAFNFTDKDNRINMILGGSWNNYNGRHFGDVIWAEWAEGTEKDEVFYDNDALKVDLNNYIKVDYLVTDGLDAFLDLQFRKVDYTASGMDIGNISISKDTSMTFFNPKAGLTWRLGSNHRIFGSFAIANREPTRNDFIDADPGDNPLPETMYDYELGYEFTANKVHFGLNLYYMDYENQLVLTGELNDVGAPVRTNVDESYRAGVEAYWGVRILENLRWEGNFTYSQNKIAEFTEVLYDYLNDEVIENTYTDTDISFSPAEIASSILTYEPVKGMEVAWMTKYVGRQYLDNTQDLNRSIDPYLINDARISYSFKTKVIPVVSVNVLVNNVLDEQYASKGYTFSYLFGEQITENYYYPQAGTNILAGLTLKF